MRKSFTLLLAAMLLALVACDNNGQSLSSLDENPAPAQPELLTLSVQADPAALVRSDDLQAQFLAQVVQLRVTVYNSAAQEVASKTVARDGTAVFLLPAGNYWVRMIGLDGNQNVLGYFDRLIELLQNLFNRFPGLIWTPNPPVVTIADPA
ncbi:MAG: hypothetical protein KC910_00655, partial [Candidatus Eremiobacteraeota bacterium]|nr:hypothetical protein [Candidatus Eremiobacteraeota bacterium]